MEAQKSQKGADGIIRYSYAPEREQPSSFWWPTEGMTTLRRDLW